ncbi:N-acetylmuramoyl-L-alanine amidase [Isoptericola sp. NPDC057391]|uniref:N-acetylmuramoyl-L-alanine amidase n=1 Tax=Isoptericola sp. NPDC057391 TaxID=3346117 RepID=UPI0036256D2D
MSRWGRICTAGGVTTALALGGVVVPTITLPVAQAHAVAPDVETLEVPGVDRGARAQAGALTEAVGGEQEHADYGQGEAAASAPAPEEGQLAALSPRRTTQEFLVAGVTWEAPAGAGAEVGADVGTGATAGADPEVTEVAVRLHEDGAWTDWRALGLDGVVTEEGRTGTEPITSAGADGIQVRVRTADGETPPGLEVDVVDPGTSAADATVGAGQAPAASANAATGRELRPSVVTRKQWGADESLRGSWPTVSGRLDAIYVHHTAGTNSYSRSQSAAIVRGIYAYHTKSRGWPDIGYQLLVDRFGRIFQGRSGAVDDNPIGAHAGGYNTGTIGVSAMGDFEVARPTSALLTALTHVVAWKAYQYGVGPKSHVTLPTGTSTGSDTRARPGQRVRVPAITMHRTTNHTTCPGRYLAGRMKWLRNAVQDRVDRAKSYYGTVRPAVGRPNGSFPADQTPAQWASAPTYRWSRVSGAAKYQVLQKYAKWNEDMPDMRYWRVLGTTTSTSMKIRTSPGWTRHVAVRAISKNGDRGRIETITRSARPVPASSWTRSSTWKRVTGSGYESGQAFRSSHHNAQIRIANAHQVRSVRIMAATGPGYGRVQVLVGGKAYKTINLSSARFNPRKGFPISLGGWRDGTVTLRNVDHGKEVRISAIALARN